MIKLALASLLLILLATTCIVGICYNSSEDDKVAELKSHTETVNDFSSLSKKPLTE